MLRFMSVFSEISSYDRFAYGLLNTLEITKAIIYRKYNFVTKILIVTKISAFWRMSTHTPILLLHFSV